MEDWASNELVENRLIKWCIQISEYTIERKIKKEQWWNIDETVFIHKKTHTRCLYGKYLAICDKSVLMKNFSWPLLHVFMLLNMLRHHCLLSLERNWIGMISKVAILRVLTLQNNQKCLSILLYFKYELNSLITLLLIQIRARLS